MTVVMKMSRVEASQVVAKNATRYSPGATYSHSMIRAEELIHALEVLGVIRFDTPRTPAEIG
jgi:hypothetical protein